MFRKIVSEVTSIAKNVIIVRFDFKPDRAFTNVHFYLFISTCLNSSISKSVLWIDQLTYSNQKKKKQIKSNPKQTQFFVRSSSKNENFQFQTSTKTYATQATFDVKVSSTTHAPHCLCLCDRPPYAMPIIVIFVTRKHSPSPLDVCLCENSVRGENSIAYVPAKRASHLNVRRVLMLLFLNCRSSMGAVRAS